MSHLVTNQLLHAYEKQVGPSFLSRFEAVSMPFKMVLFKNEERPRYVHLLTSGVASLLSLMSGGTEVEVAMTGREGFAEAIYLLGPEVSARTCVMQVPGTALRMRFAEFEEAFQTDTVLRKFVLRLVQFQSMMATQLVACNGQHDAEERLARWLLMVQDRVNDSDLPLTQEFLGQMLGARRSTVTIVASNLQRAGLIEYHRGHIKIHERERLSEVACECYGYMRKLYENLNYL